MSESTARMLRNFGKILPSMMEAWPEGFVVAELSDEASGGAMTRQ